MKHVGGDISLRYVLLAVRRRWRLIVLCVILAAGVALAYSLVQKKQYTAQTSILFRDPQFDQKLFGTSYVQNQPDPSRVAATNLDLVTLPRVAALTARHLHHTTEAQVSSAVSASSVGQSDLVSIQATAATPRFAAKLANAYADQFIVFRRNKDRATINSAEVPLRRQIAGLPSSERYGALGQELQQRLGQLRVLASLQTGGAELVQPAQVPTGPSSPKPVRNGALGVFLGILLGIAVSLLVEAFDRRLRTTDEVEEIFERPLLASLPESDQLGRADPDLSGLSESEREGLRMLWTNLRYFTVSRDIRSVLVTSANHGDGKSTVAWGLGVAAASAGRRTLVIEADLRNPSFATRWRLPARAGLTSALAGDATFDDAVVSVRLAGGEGGSGAARSMDVLCAGPRPPDPADLLQSHLVGDFLAWLKERYELIVLDTAPPTMVSDTIPLITLVDGVVVVNRIGRTLRDHAHRLRQQLDHLNAPVLGVVVNGVQETQPYDYPYGYGYAPPRMGAQRSNGHLQSGEVELPKVRASTPEDPTRGDGDDQGAHGSERASTGYRPRNGGY